jgi:hypothetical protein
MDVAKFETANSWFSAMHAKGYEVPITLCQAIEKLMRVEKISFSLAYKRLDLKNRIIFKDKVISFK